MRSLRLCALAPLAFALLFAPSISAVAASIPAAPGASALLSDVSSAGASRPALSSIADLKPDSGKFSLTIQENEIGTDTFKSAGGGSSEGDVSVSLAGKKTKLHISVKAHAGHLEEISTTADPGGKFTLTINGHKGKFTVPGKTPIVKEVTVPDHLFLFGSFAPHLLSNLAAGYDYKKGGAQPVNLIIVENGALVKGTLTFTGASTIQAAGKPLQAFEFLLGVPSPVGNVDLDFSVDGEGRVLRWNVPGQKYLAAREGYQETNEAAGPGAALLSRPTFMVKKEPNIKISMRDGIKLAVDIYRPDAPGKFPVILQRTPYGRDKAFEATFYAKRGYVFVAQDVRGKFGSGGKWSPFIHEPRDGYDTIEWCAAQPWSTGDVGMIGGSYLGFVQWAAAREGSKHLKCLIPIVSPPDPFFNVPYSYGAFFLFPSLWWSAIVEGKRMNAIPTFKDTDPFTTLPLVDVDKKLFGRHIPFFQEWLRHSSNDSYWQQASFDEKIKSIGSLPALHVSGWFDGDGIGTKLNYAAMVSSGHQYQRLVYGPWSHAVDTSSSVADLNFGAKSFLDLDTLYLRWFDHWLKGIDNGVEREPPVNAFLMGASEWRAFSAWPPTEAKITRWYLHSLGKANTSAGNGSLSINSPGAHEPYDHYTYDPHLTNTTPDNKKMAEAGANPSLSVSSEEHQKGILVYSSPVLQKDVTVAGPISLHLTASTSARDTDWAAVLTDVYPSGKSIRLCTGIFRARFRKSFSRPVLLKPGEIAEYTIDLWAIGNVFQKGHRIRIDVTSSLFPLYDRNLNTGGDIATGTAMVIAHQRIYHDAAHPSYVVLPIL